MENNVLSNPRNNARIVSAAALLAGAALGFLGSGRLYEVTRSFTSGTPWQEALDALAVRPFPLAPALILIALQLAFLAWQFAFYGARAVRLLIPGLLAAAIIIMQHMLAGHESSHIICHGPCLPSSGWATLSIFISIAGLGSAMLGSVGKGLLGIPRQDWIRVRLAAFAWVNGGLLMMLAQMAYLHARFGSGAFSIAW